MKKLYFINIILILLFAAHCFEEEPYVPFSDMSGNAWFFCIGQAPNTTTTVKFQDMNNGTIKATTTEITTHPCFPLTIRKITYIKKCVQGQVYRLVQNDCQGAGTSGDNWGAQTFQFCPTNDAACETGYVANASSPAQASCYADTTAGRSWKLLPSVETVLNPFYVATGINLLTYFPDVPIDPNYIWARNAPTIDKANSFKFSNSGTVNSVRQFKNSFFYVQCGSY